MNLIKGFARSLLPYGFVNRLHTFHALERFGVSKATAFQAVMKNRNIQQIDNARLLLLPTNARQKIRHVVDVGANIGDWSAAILRYCDPVTLTMVEPNPNLLTILQGRFTDPGRVNIISCAVGDRNGKTELQLTRGNQCSSILQPCHQMPALYGSIFETVGAIEVPLATLDSLTEHIPEVSLLKIDVQGYEREVILGALDTLSKTRYILIEANFVSHYLGATSFLNIHELLTAEGFKLARISQPCSIDERVLWTDALYVSERLQ